jgi:hypothetical protein
MDKEKRGSFRIAAPFFFPVTRKSFAEKERSLLLSTFFLLLSRLLTVGCASRTQRKRGYIS